jgi:predicted chitinase
MPTVLERPAVEAEAEFENDGFNAEAAHTQYILDALAEAEEYDARPDAVSYSSEEVWRMFEKKYIDQRP